MRLVVPWASLVLALAVACRSDDPKTGDTAAPEAVCDLPLLYEKSPGDALQGAGWHRIYVQGGSSTPDAEGRYSMSEHRNEVESSDHFLLSMGALVEWTYPVVDPITGTVALHVAKVDEPGVTVRYELSLVHDRVPLEILSVDDAHEGVQGYVPFEGCYLRLAAAVVTSPGDYLLMRATNLTGGELGIVISAPDYYTWVDVEVAP